MKKTLIWTALLAVTLCLATGCPDKTKDDKIEADIKDLKTYLKSTENFDIDHDGNQYDLEYMPVVLTYSEEDPVSLDPILILTMKYPNNFESAYVFAKDDDGVYKLFDMITKDDTNEIEIEYCSALSPSAITISMTHRLYYEGTDPANPSPKEEKKEYRHFEKSGGKWVEESMR